MNTFYTLLTALGLAKLTNAQISQTKVNVSHVAVGDGNGAYYEPNENMIALRRETWRGGTSRVAVAVDNPNWIEIEVTVPANVGGFYIREVGVFDDAGTLIAIAKYPETYKPTVDFGSTKDLNIKIIIELNNTNSVEVKIDPHIITASRAYVDQKIAESIGSIGTGFTELEDRVATHEAEKATVNKAGHVQLYNDLNSSDETKALTAAAGKLLNDSLLEQEEKRGFEKITSIKIGSEVNSIVFENLELESYQIIQLIVQAGSTSTGLNNSDLLIRINNLNSSHGNVPYINVSSGTGNAGAENSANAFRITNGLLRPALGFAIGEYTLINKINGLALMGRNQYLNTGIVYSGFSGYKGEFTRIECISSVGNFASNSEIILLGVRK